MDVEEYLPLAETTFFILLALASGARNSYAIMKEVDELSAGRVDLSTGRLHAELKRLREQQWVKEVADPMLDASGRERKGYTMSEFGREIMGAETKRLRQLVAAADLCTQEDSPGEE